MDIDLSGKIAFITGSTAGIGLATARGLAEAGAQVIVNGRKKESVNKAIAKMTDSMPDANIAGFAGDLS